MLRVTAWLIVALATLTALSALYRASSLPLPGELAGELIVYATLYGTVAFLARHNRGISWGTLLPLRGAAPGLVIPILLVSMGGFVLSVQAMAFCKAMNVLPPEMLALASGATRTGAGAPHDPSLLRQLVIMSLIPAFAEEALFRGLVLQALLGAMSARRAIVISALLFTAAHFSIEKFPGIFLLGLLYGWMFVRTGSLLPGMTAHAFHNAMATLASRVEAVPISVYRWIAPDRHGLLPARITWVAAALMVIGLVGFRQALRRGARAGGRLGGTGGAPLDAAA
jgi:membrane protease YdiL (CAAX protease family)